MRPRWQTTWSNTEGMKPSNWISATGRMPLTARPMAEPMMPISARGVSTTLSSPYFFQRPSVALNTPPFLPTSSPRIMTRPSLAIATSNASFTACTRLSSRGPDGFAGAEDFFTGFDFKAALLTGTSLPSEAVP
jgi:hypothetical protein